MKCNLFYANVSLCLVCAGLMLVSCEKTPGIRVSSDYVIIDAFPEEPVNVDISVKVDWTVKVIHTDEAWLTVNPLQGKGDATITIEAAENHEFTERIARIAISGVGVKTDTIRVVQMPDMDISEYIEDEAFREYCLREFDKSPTDGKLSMKEARSVAKETAINVRRLHIKSLAGIEYFVRVEKLYCNDNEIESLDVSKNLALRDLNCSNNSIKSLEVSANVELRKLNCSYNPIQHIDVSELEKLTDLDIYNAELTSIDVSNNARLMWLAVSNNKVANIDVSKNPELQGLECNDNGLTSLTVSNNLKLRTLYCGSNKLNTLNLEKNTELTHLWCNNNQFSVLNLNNNKDLQTFVCSNNNFSSINLSTNTKLTQLICNTNHITTLNLNNNPDLKQLHCDANQLTSLDLSSNTKLEDLSCTANQLPKELSINKNDRLNYIDVRNNSNLTTIYVWQGFIEDERYHKKDKDAQWVKLP